MALISVIVPVYNAEQTLRRCVDSILSQEFQNFELLLIDDGSIDESPAICDEYAKKDSRVQVFHKENGGVSSARNLGLDSAKGKWVTFVDSDDYLKELYFTGVEERYEDILFSGYKTYYQGNVIRDIAVKNKHSFNLLISENINNTIIRGPVAKFFKKSCIDEQRFNPKCFIGEDVCFVFGYLAKCKTYHVLDKSEYIIVWGGIPDEEKYAISVRQSVETLSFMREEFEKMAVSHGINRANFFNFINYYKRISKSDWQNDVVKWYHNTEIRRLYKYVWPDLSILQKIRLIGSIIFRA